MAYLIGAHPTIVLCISFVLRRTIGPTLQVFSHVCKNQLIILISLLKSCVQLCKLRRDACLYV